ncbi:bacteriophage abortive infection AbiH family protein [Enterococcus innesii]|nr:bacteriophage abortive infection AbiH family protein [Enterococcus innesii]
MVKLFIIGNGFDISHNLPTRYNDFLNYLLNFQSGINFVEAIEKFSYYNTPELWSNFEEHLGYLSADSVIDEANHRRIEFNAEFDYETLDDSHITHFLQEDYYSALNNLDDYVKKWAKSVEILGIERIEKYQNIFDPESIFVTFNYTKVLEEIYEIEDDRILHIHGDTDNEPIMGHGRDQIQYTSKSDNRSYDIFEEEFRKNMFYGFSDFYNSSQKDISLFKIYLRSFISQYDNDISEIFVIGHSLGRVDSPYFEFLREHFENISIKVSYYGKVDYERKENYLNEFRLDNFELDNNFLEI